MTTDKNTSVDVQSEIGELQGVIIHSPGSEVENMTPENAERALYSDILNLSVAKNEYSQFRGVLQKVTRVYEVNDLLASVLKNDKVRSGLLSKICLECNDPHLMEYMASLDNPSLASAMIEGVALSRDSLSRFLSQQRFSLRPLHNFFFTRDASVSIGNNVMISKMANAVRDRESQIMEAIFDYYPPFRSNTFTANPENHDFNKTTIEGGDVLIAGKDIILVGIGTRTTAQGVDVIIDKLRNQNEKKHIIVQELPIGRESFIHLDMVFTFLSREECMVFEPVILQPNRYKTIHITIDNGDVAIKEEKNILESISSLGMDLKPIFCGGTTDLWQQEREQWHSGANFFAIAPGNVIGYGRNRHTSEEMDKNGYEIIPAVDVISNKVKVEDYSKYVVTIEGAELSRGGGGARCMTMPVRRKTLD